MKRTKVTGKASRTTGLKPLLKWAGGKGWFGPTLARLYEPHRDREYAEPFAGGLAGAFALQPVTAQISDANPHLMNFYMQVSYGLRFSIEMRNDAGLFRQHRDRFNQLVASGNAYTREAAELFFYLNRTCFNGLCRFSTAGEFNVPFGKYKTVDYERDLEPYRALLRKWLVIPGPFEEVGLVPGAFVYADPPYDDGFTSYTGQEFSLADQVRLADALAEHDGPVVASNLATERMIALYAQRGFDVRIVRAPRRISATGDRAAVGELLATKNLGAAAEVVESLPSALDGGQTEVGAHAPPLRRHGLAMAARPVGPAPLLPWFGDNRELIPELRRQAPTEFGTYHEPFLGSGCLFRDLVPTRAVLSDANHHLIRAYATVRDHVEAVIAMLKQYRDDPEFFASLCPGGGIACLAHPDDVTAAATMVYLNRVCRSGPRPGAPFRGDYFVDYDASGRGDRIIADEQQLRAWSQALRGSELRHEDFSAVLTRAQPGDLVYLDPPEVGPMGASGRTPYAAYGFSIQDQQRVCAVAEYLKSQGVHVLLTNTVYPLVEDLYSRTFQLTKVLPPMVADRMGRTGPGWDHYVIS